LTFQFDPTNVPIPVNMKRYHLLLPVMNYIFGIKSTTRIKIIIVF
jgi:hypothetical protein